MGLLLGGMVIVAAVTGPLVFTRMPVEHRAVSCARCSRSTIREVLVTAVVGAAALPTVAAVTVWLRQGLIAVINALSDAAQAGEKGARGRFDRAHRLSVIINAVQLLVVAWSLVRLA